MTLEPWHQEAWAHFNQRIEQNNLPQAILLTGEHGLGKQAFAEHMVARLLCHEPQHGMACGQCSACKLLMAQTHPDDILIDLELNKSQKKRTFIIVEQIRAMARRLARASQMGGRQIATINPADHMNPAAANALLKTLEEPSADSIIILLATRPWYLPATIRSRCQTIALKAPKREVALEWLARYQIDQVESILDLAGGNPGIVRQWQERDVLDECALVNRDLASLAERETQAYTVMKRWTCDDNLPDRLHIAAMLLAQEVRRRSTDKLPQLANGLGTSKVYQWYKNMNKARRLLNGQLRTDLLVLDAVSIRSLRKGW